MNTTVKGVRQHFFIFAALFAAFFAPIAALGYTRQPSENVDTQTFAITIESGLCEPAEVLGIMLRDDSETLYSPAQVCSTDCVDGDTIIISSPDGLVHDVTQVWLTCDENLYGESPLEGSEGKIFGLWGFGTTLADLLSPFFDNIGLILAGIAAVIVTLFGIRFIKTRFP